MARLTNPYTVHAVEAEGELAERLKAAGFRPEARRRAPRKGEPKKPKTTE